MDAGWVPRSVPQTVYKSKCDFCFLDSSSPEGLDVCLECDCCACNDHFKYHAEKYGHKFYVNIRYEEKKESSENTETLKDKEQEKIITVHSIEKGLLNEENCSNYNELYLLARKIADADETRYVPRNKSTSTTTNFDDFVINCDHLDSILEHHRKTSNKDEFPQIIKDECKCADCDIKENLWLCLTCGHLGCGRAQIGCVGNGHALQHYKETGHPISIKIGTLSATRLPDIYCYSCDIEPVLKEEDPRLIEILKSFKLSLSGEPTEKSLSQIEDEMSKKLAMMSSLEGGPNLPLVNLNSVTGIANVGCTCYASAAVQAVHSCIDRLGTDITFDKFINHWKDCMYNNMRECIRCQEFRLLSSIESVRVGDERSKYIKPDCGDLIPLACPSFAYERGALQDASEFLMNWIQRSNILRQRCGRTYVRCTISCSSCGGKKYTKEEFPDILGIPITDSVDIAHNISDIFKPVRCEGRKCPFCDSVDGINGVEIFKTTEILSAPDVILVQPLRAVYTPAGVVKLENNVEVPETIDLSEFLAKKIEKDDIYETAWDIRRAIEQSREEEENMDTKESNSACDSEKLSLLLELGIASEDVCRAALVQTNNNYELAADLILSGSVSTASCTSCTSTSPLAELEKEKQASDAAMAEECQSTRAPAYTLWAFVTHQGSSPQAGHYVCHTRLLERQAINATLKEDTDTDKELLTRLTTDPTHSWVVLNDERVAVSPQPPLGQGFVYAYASKFTP